MLERFDISHEFWEQFGVRKKNTQKRLGLFEIEHIDDACFVTIATNPKEYIEYFKSELVNKKHKGIKKSENCMNLESFAKRISSLREIEEYEDESEMKEATVDQSGFTVKKNEMVLETVQKKKFGQLNDKRYYFQCGIVSLPFSHPYLNKTNQFKWGKKQRIENWVFEEKEVLKKLEKEAILKNHRLSTLQTIYDQMPQFRNIHSNKRCQNDIENINLTMNTRR